MEIMEAEAKGQRFNYFRVILTLGMGIGLLWLLWVESPFRFFKVDKERLNFTYLLCYLLKGIVCLYLFKVIIKYDFLPNNSSQKGSWVNQLEVDSYKEEIKNLKMERHDFKNQLQTIYTMLELNKVNGAKVYLKELSSDLDELKEDLGDDYLIPVVLLPKREEARRAGIDFKLKLNAELNQIALPPNKLFRILFNLVDNALDILGKSSQDKKLIEVKLLDDQNKIDLIVGNNGPTIPHSLLANIFEAGYSTKGKDRGFGLYIVKSLLEEYGGKVDVKSKKGIMTQFICTLPKV
ncbi:sensor kinase SpoOB-type protein [Orenia metallireducens]|uniref:histidine kinase n=1 Tax=Orenia metallireducens TaxID=1413210 RepID=A0A285FFC7_9FIRM|nr:ATP-binding protein [Orenia metallireducens]PRX33505.1 sensor kinase SpoOB-type protein [Orenia metallireducens]SNY09763.1 Sensor_kinase_SpoOB-type, alpha-helical domain [Orenia metallireducens]